MTDITIYKINEVYNKIYAEPALLQELSENFTFDVPGAEWSPKFKSGDWDGKIRLLNTRTGLIYVGLNRHIEQWCTQKGYEYTHKPSDTNDPLSMNEVKEFVEALDLPMVPHEEQIKSFVKCVRERRSLILSPTASGKSLIIYMLARYYNEIHDSNVLIIVPNISLIHQLTANFHSYSNGSDIGIHSIYQGKDKFEVSKITISTWQSIYQLPRKYFKHFDVVIGDEAHQYKAKSLIDIMTKLENTKYRFGFSGTLDGSKTNELTLEGLFGPVYRVTTTAELIKKKRVAELKIKAIVLNYPDQVRKMIAAAKDYQTELDFLTQSPERNKFICNLALSLEGNSLILFQYVDKHGKKLFQQLQDMAPDRKIFYVSGEVEGEEREEIRGIMENEQNAIVCASYGTFSTGVDIRNLHNLIFASPTKSVIRVLQSVGRVLRVSDTKTAATLFDIADDLTYKDRKNHTLEHFSERIKIYSSEKFPYRIYPVSTV